MANIALDIKANTTKALGEFKKLSRELDNKFLVQGLKLDVVKNAFRQINREFEQSLGSQGLSATESTAQAQRNAAANLAIFSKLGTQASLELTKATKAQLNDLVAQGEITKEALLGALNIQGFLKFDGADFASRSRELTVQIAKFGQDLNDAFGTNNSLDVIQKIATGEYRVDDLQRVDFGGGGAGANLFREALLQASGGAFDSLTGSARTEAIEEALKVLRDDTTRIGSAFRDIQIEADKANNFRFALRDITSIFSEDGLFGPLRTIGTTTDFGGRTVDRNVLQLTGRLLSTIFDKDDGLFAVLFKSLGEAFGFDPENAIEPLLRGIELTTFVFEKVTEFFGSATFKKFLGIFDPLIAVIEGIELPKTISAEEIQTGIGNIFGGIREVLGNLSGYISSIDTTGFEQIVGTFIGEVIKTLPAVLDLVFESITKIIDVVLGVLTSQGVGEANFGEVIAKVLNGLGEIILKGIQAIIIAVPRIISAAVSTIGNLDTKGLAVLGLVVANFVGKLFTGQGLLGMIKERIGGALGIRQMRGSGGINASAARGNEQTRWNRLYTYLENILRALNGEGPLDPSDGPDRRRRGQRVGRDGRTSRQRARDIRRVRRNRQALNFGRGVRGRFMNFGTDVIRRTEQGFGRLGRSIAGPRYSSPIGPLPINSVEPWARRGLADPRSLRGGQLYTPRLQSTVLPSRFSQGVQGLRGAAGSAIGGIRGAAGGAARMAGGALRGARGLASRIPGGALIGTALGALAIGSIFSGGRAQAASIDARQDLSKEEKEFYKKQNEKETRAAAGKSIVGLAGGAIGGGIGFALGGPLGAVVGGMIGDMVGNIIGDLLPAPITEGIGKLAEDVGKWFANAWNGVSKFVGDTGKAIGGFFTSIFDFFYNLPGRMLQFVEDGINNVRQGLIDLPGNIWEGIKSVFTGGGGKDEPSPNFSGGFKALGGRTAFNEYEALNMPDGVTYIPLTASNTLDRFVSGGSRTTNNNMEITVNVTGTTNPEATAELVIAEIDKIYSSVNV